MVPSAPMTGPGVTAPSRFRRHRTVPDTGPSDVDDPLRRASCNAAGHADHVETPGDEDGRAAADDVTVATGAAQPPTSSKPMASSSFRTTPP